MTGRFYIRPILLFILFICFGNVLALSEMDLKICNAYENQQDKDNCIKELEKRPKEISSKSTQTLKYKVVKDVYNKALKKCNVTIVLSQKITKTKLIKIGKQLKAERPHCYRLWTFYYTSNMKIGSVAWATTHFTPDLEVDIFGSTAEEDLSIQKLSATNNSILGQWKSEQTLMGAIITLYKSDNGDFRIKTVFPDKSISDEKVVKSSQNGKIRYDDNNTHGEYYIIEDNGNLGFYGNNGKFGEAIKIN
ncbi:hypothetical protein [Legionella impletisoli]|uniref:Uncharacterized protein n=1 Tax=Legionella impletisoli TaxID=343510 RepID=A0A917JY80_9GAMM|nr:hypothetical protein [Legionella impletisoli]GGI92412.1 hypothetical protein GCM10007966_21310 [Legionella impletisoli]